MISKETASTQLIKSDHHKSDYSKPPMISRSDMRLFLGRHLHIALNQLSKKYGNVFQMRVDSRNFVVINEVETIKEALVKQQDSFNNKADFNAFKLKPQAEFLELKSGQAWKKHHDIVMKNMQAFLLGNSDIQENCVTQEAEKLADDLLTYSGQPLEPALNISIATMSFIERLVFDKMETKDDQEIVKVAASMRTIPNGLLNAIVCDVIPKKWQPVYGLLNQKSLKSFVGSLGIIDNYLLNKIDEHKKSFDPNNLRNFTDGLLQASSEVSESDRNDFQLSESDVVKGTLFQFVAAGTQLPSYVLSWGILYMIAYPEIQAKIQKELDEVVGKEQQISFRERNQLPFTEACINEIFRHSSSTTFPPINYATTTDAILGDYFIPQNSPLIINYYGLTRDERYWEKPEEFNPYRFLDENGKLRKDLTDKFFPFGIGSRRCIGEYLGRLEIFSFFTNLLRKCSFEKVAGEKLSFKAQLPGPFLSPRKYRVIVKSRF